MRTWLITVGESLPLRGKCDKLIRTGRLAQYLGARGHEIIWWSSTFDHFRKMHHFDESTEVPLEDGVLLKLLHAPPYASNVSLARLRHQQITAKEFERQAKGMSVPDVILCSYPTIELSRAAVQYARRVGCRVALDIRDLWPDIFLAGLPRALRPLGRPAIWAYNWLGQSALRSADGIVAVSEGYLAWALDKAGRNRSDEVDAVLPIGFARPEIQERDLATARRQLADRGVRFDKMLAVFVGTFGRTYDLSTVLRAARVLEQTLPELQLVLAGDGDNGERWRQESRGLVNVLMPGWLDRNQLAALCSGASIGLQSYSAGAPQGLANKLFEYLGYGMALVSSLKGENAALIEQHACGVNYRPGDAPDLYAKLTELVRSENRLEMAQRNARALFEREFSLPLIHEHFLVYLERLGAFRRKANS